MRAGDYERDPESGILMPRRRGIERAHPQWMCGPALFGGAPALATDPYYSSVGLLLHGDGANGSTTTVDSSGSPKTITSVGGAALSTAQAKFGPSSMAFTTSGSAFTAPSSSAFDFGTSDFTVECFIYPTNASFATNQGLVVRDSIGGTRGWLLYLADNTGGGTTWRALTFAAWSGSTVASVYGTIVPAVNAWTHCAITRASGVFRLFVGGVLAATQSGFTSLSIGSSGTPLCVGSLYGTTGPYASSSIQGYQDDVRVTPGVARYTAAFTPPTAAFPDAGPSDPNYASRVLGLHLDGVNGATTFPDNSPTPKTVTAQGGAKISTALSKFGGASLVLNGSADYLAITHASGFNVGTGDFTIAGWIYSGLPGLIQAIFSYQKSTGLALQFRTNASNKLEAVLRDAAGGTAAVITGATTLSASTWTHVAMSRASGTVRLFVNGALDATSTGQTQSLTDASINQFVGVISDGTGTSSFFSGNIDDLLFYSVAVYTAAFTAPVAAFPNS